MGEVTLDLWVLLGIAVFLIWKLAVSPWVDQDTRESAFVLKRIRGRKGLVITSYRIRCLFCGYETDTGRVPAGRCARCGGHITQAPEKRRLVDGGLVPPGLNRIKSPPPQDYVKPEPTPAPPPRKP
ncbi:hypothetical protein 13AC503A_gene0022 [Aeromonas phage 13AC503A]|nr:hypothetical protein 13AC503A_gene0022 [Aeromonas phage 13AC503A]